MRNKDSNPSVSSETSSTMVKELTTSFLAVLDNDDVIAKLSQALTVSFQLILDEKLKPINESLSKIMNEQKKLSDRIESVEKEQNNIIKENDKLYSELDYFRAKLNHIEQNARSNSFVIDGISETYAERVADVGDGEATSREDCIASVRSAIKESCNIEVSPTDIVSAYRLKTRRSNAPRPILVTFHSTSLRQKIIKSRRPKQTLVYQHKSIYFNDHLTEMNNELLHKAKTFVKNHDAYAAWVRDGAVFVKWEQDSKPVRIRSYGDFY
jgi:regulator of replication initiation timing